MTSITGTARSIHWKNGMRMWASVSSWPRAIKLGGVPTGVPIPPIEAAYAVTSMSAVP